MRIKKKSITMDTVMGTFALICNMIGSFLIASNIGLNVYGYAFFILGEAGVSYLLIKSNVDRTVLFTYVFFFAMNVMGIYKYWT